MSSRIITLTLNPAVDLACEADAVIPTRKVRTTTEQFDPGGGGINVARVVRELGGEALAVLLIGGGTGRFLQELLDEARVECLRIPVSGRTRIAVAVHERSSGLEYTASILLLRNVAASFPISDLPASDKWNPCSRYGIISLGFSYAPWRIR